MDTTKARAFTPGRVAALGLIAVLDFGLGYLRFAPDEGLPSLPMRRQEV